MEAFGFLCLFTNVYSVKPNGVLPTIVIYVSGGGQQITLIALCLVRGVSGVHNLCHSFCVMVIIKN